MKTKFLTASMIAAAMAAGFAAAPAMAQPGPYTVYAPGVRPVQTPGIDNAQQAISDRIQQGLQSGRITPSEARALYRRDRDIQNREAAYKSDGRVTLQERQQLRTDMANLSAEVERAIANNRNVPVVQQGGRLGAIDSQEFAIGQRIDEGVRSHRLSLQEAGRLQAREQAIERREAAYRSDGVVTQQERRQLRAELTALRDEVERLINPRG